MRSCIASVLLFVSFSAPVLPQQQDAPPIRLVRRGLDLPPGATFFRDMAYGQASSQIMDVYLPPNPRNAPIILMVHGGGWRIGDKTLSDVVVNKANHWLRRGYVFISADNRLLPSARPLEQAQDVAKALSVVQAKAASWGADPNRIVLMGHSAGAHLVDLLSTSPSLVAGQGAKSWLATVSLDTATLDLMETMQGPHYRLYDNAFGSDPAYWNQNSPMQQLTRTPMPMFLICSTIRPDHPCPQAERFAAKVKSLGGRAMVLPQNLSHMQVNANLGLPGAYTDAVDAFLQKLGLP
ncbi:alpha/beta hydrolase [Terriglobus albidus]|uniref:alpha/beta hydrolase n=1 Tax=Terriglobus albidus TaxID=1592106 RepID=UPI001C9D5249|nr:alpha/beta hydrolase [Terriglobus albidus]